MKCKVWGKLNPIFSAQEEIEANIVQDMVMKKNKL